MTHTSSSPVSPVSPVSPASDRALVLGGGGAAGNAWLIGLSAGLAQAGLDVTLADVTIGTSAGATTAAQFAGATPADLLAATLASPGPASAAGARPSAAGARPDVPRSADAHLARFTAIIADSADIVDMRRRMGALALAADPGAAASWQASWRKTVAARLPLREWPERDIRVTAVDAATAEPVVFDRASGVDLVDAVAASCAGGAFAYRVGGRACIDGGYRSSPENADLAAGCRRVLILSPLGGRSRYPTSWGASLAHEVETLRESGSEVRVVIPDPDAAELLRTPMNPAHRAPVARSGHRQGVALAAELADLWA